MISGMGSVFTAGIVSQPWYVWKRWEKKTEHMSPRVTLIQPRQIRSTQGTGCYWLYHAQVRNVVFTVITQLLMSLLMLNAWQQWTVSSDRDNDVYWDTITCLRERRRLFSVSTIIGYNSERQPYSTWLLSKAFKRLLQSNKRLFLFVHIFSPPTQPMVDWV